MFLQIFDFFHRKKAASSPELKKESDLGRVKMIMEYLNNHDQTPVCRIRAEETNSASITGSRFGGYPYWEPSMEYPTSKDGKPLYLLAQINFEETDFCGDFLPKEGILQFFIACSDNYGLNFHTPAQQENFRIVYHPKVDYAITADDVTAMGIRANTDLDLATDPFPFYRAYCLSFQPGCDSINPHMDAFDDAVRNAVFELFGETMEGSAYKYFSASEYDYLVSKSSGWGHKLLGLPAFTQEDPRFGESLEKYDTLLLQIDSDCKDIMWGDSGICNFFINSGMLKSKDFSDVIYNWDCY